MKILIPGKPDVNPYLKEITTYSRHQWLYGNLEDTSLEFDAINIHWPEAIFNWETPSVEQLEALEKTLHRLTMKFPLVYTRHDEKNNFAENYRLKKLRDIVIRYAKGIIHLGKLSKDNFQRKYPDKIHTIIAHPLYINSYLRFPKHFAKNKLGIPTERVVIMAPGRIRHSEERKMVLKFFKLLPINNKTLLASRMKPFRTIWPYRGKTRINKIINKIWREFLFTPPKYYFFFTFSSEEKLSLMISACDLLIIPRTNILNSGTFFLGLSFEKIMVGPDVGNISEHLKQFNFPVFRPRSRTSMQKAIDEVMAINAHNHYNSLTKELGDLHPKKISNLYDQFLQLIKQS